MNWSLQSLHRKGAVLMVILTLVLVAISVTVTVIGPRDWRLAGTWAMTALLTASTIELVRRVRRADSGASKKLVQDDGTRT